MVAHILVEFTPFETFVMGKVHFLCLRSRMPHHPVDVFLSCNMQAAAVAPPCGRQYWSYHVIPKGGVSVVEYMDDVKLSSRRCLSGYFRLTRRIGCSAWSLTTVSPKRASRWVHCQGGRCLHACAVSHCVCLCDAVLNIPTGDPLG